MVIDNLELSQASIEIVSGLVCIMLAIIVVINGRHNKSIKRIVDMFVLASIAFIAEALAYIFRGNTDPLSVFMTRVTNFSVFAVNCLLTIAAMEYIYSILHIKNITPSRHYKRIIYCVSAVAFLMLLINIFTGWMYRFDASNYYHRNTMWYVFTMLEVITIIVSCVLIIRYRKQLSVATLASLLFFELVPLIAVIIQSLYYGIAITNIGIGISVIFILITYLIDWGSRSNSNVNISKIRRSTETIILFVIMLISISASIISCIISLKRMAADTADKNTHIIAHIVHDNIDNMFLRPITVTETMSKDAVLKEYFRDSETDDVTDEMAEYLGSIRDGFGYEMLYAVPDKTRTYYTYDGIIKTVDVENDPTDAWYAHFLKAGKATMLEVDTDPANDWDLSVFVNSAVIDHDGTFLGVCGTGVSMKDIQLKISGFEKSYGIKISLVDKGGLVQISSETEDIESLFIDMPKNISENAAEFTQYKVGNTYRLIKYIDELGWYLIVESADSFGVNVIGAILPNIIIFIVGLFMLAVAFCVIFIRERQLSGELIEKRKTSLVDELTGLKNRRAYDDDCSMIRKAGTAAEMTVIIMDVNGLKKVNDTIGHHAGDELLTGAAMCMSQTFREYGSIYRIGGDEFAALLKCSEKQIDSNARYFDKITADWRGKFVTSVSVAKGIVRGADYPNMTIDEMISLADSRMYDDKRHHYQQLNAEGNIENE